MCCKSLFGLETETSLVASGGDAQRERIVEKLLREAAQRFVHLPGRGSNRLFFENGSCLYMDCGTHPEMCTAEVSTPWDLVRYANAGDRMLAEVAASCGVIIFKGNIDYLGATFGSHESYCHTSRPELLPTLLIPHLVARTVFTGAGGFEPESPGINFTLSPRAHYIQRAVSEHSTNNRGIYHTKLEPLAGAGLQRAHLLVGDSLQSQVALFLRFGTTALVFAAIDGGLPIGGNISFENPVRALLTFAADPTCRATIETSDGRCLSAIQIERQYLAAIEAHCDHGCMPEWAPDVCALWRAELERLEQGPAAVAARLDWAIKYHMYSEYIARKGFSWERIARCNVIVEVMHREAQAKAQAQPVRARNGDGDEIEAFLGLRRQLLEMDIRFGQLGDTGLFAMIDGKGVLDHRVPGVDAIAEAMTEPPPGRAMIRGRAIRKLVHENAPAAADWMGVSDLKRQRFLNMADPFAGHYRWTAIPAGPLEVVLPTRQPSAYQFYRQGNLLRALELLGSEEAESSRAGQPLSVESRRYKAWVHARYGLTDAVSILDGLYPGDDVSLTAVGDYLQVLRFNYLVPRVEMRGWINRSRHFLDRSSDSAQAVVCLEYSAHFELSVGNVREAYRLFKKAYRAERSGMADDRIVARLLCGLALVHQRMGRVAQARRELDQAGDLQQAGEFEGDWAWNLTCQAKLESDHNLAQRLLSEARSLQAELGDRMGSTRSLLLQARITSSRQRKTRTRTELAKLRGQIPALQECPQFAHIQQHWDEWTSTHSPDANGDEFWGL